MDGKEALQLLECSDEEFMSHVFKGAQGNPTWSNSCSRACMDTAVRLRHIQQLQKNAEAENGLARKIYWLNWLIALGTLALAIIGGHELWIKLFL